MLQVSVFPFFVVTVMVQSPSLTPVTMPLLTFAIDSLDELHVTVLSFVAQDTRKRNFRKFTSVT